MKGAEGAILFDTICEGFTHTHSNQPCTHWDGISEGWLSVLGGSLPAPCVAALPNPLIVKEDGMHVIHYDVLGLTYWMLARVEEINREDLDEYERFPAVSSHAFKHGYLNRPIVDEWLYILAQVIQRQWPDIELKRMDFSIKLSHDVDQPSLYAFKQWQAILWMMAGHVIKRGDLKAFLTAPYVKIATRNKLLSSDPYNTFDWIMTVAEKSNLQSAFYFICGRTDASFDAAYEPEDPVIKRLMNDIHNRGHEIGLHPSYNTFRCPNTLKKEAEKLRHICAKEGIYQSQWGGRMHYLRWQQPTTQEAWAEAGMDYESSLGYADQIGFRCGTAHEFTAFDALKDRQYQLKIRPLIVMDNTIFSEKYMHVTSGDEAFSILKDLKWKVERVKGQLTLLFHNDTFHNDPISKVIFEKLV